MGNEMLSVYVGCCCAQYIYDDNNTQIRVFRPNPINYGHPDCTKCGFYVLCYKVRAAGQ